MANLTESTRRITTADLLDVARDQGITLRALEYWRHEGLLPKAQRTGQSGKRPEWTFPVEAANQLAALLRLREKTKQPDVLRVALWFEGFSIEIARVRTSIAAILRDSLEQLNKEIEKRRDTSGSTWGALEQAGRLLARRRGRHGLPRFGRQKLSDRERAMSLMLGLAVGDADTSARLERDADQVERMLGVDRGRRSRAGLPAWLDGPPGEGLEALAYLGSLPALIETIETATDEELEASRALGRVVLDGITAFTRFADAFAVDDNAVGLGAIEVFRGEPLTAAWLPAFVIGMSRSATLRKNLQSVVGALKEEVLPSDERARELAALSDEDLQQRLPEMESLPFIERVRLKRLLAKYRSEQPK